MSCGVEDGKDDDGIHPHDEEDPIGKTSGQNTARVRAFAELKVNERVFYGPPDGLPNFEGEFQSESALPFVIP